MPRKEGTTFLHFIKCKKVFQQKDLHFIKCKIDVVDYQYITNYSILITKTGVRVKREGFLRRFDKNSIGFALQGDDEVPL